MVGRTRGRAIKDGHYNYGRLLQEAFRTVIRKVLGQVAEEGLLGNHHFYVTFSTRHPGVSMADWLRERYADELTIVLQHEFSDLAVMDNRFSVTLSFGDRVEQLVVPFDAIKTFVDPWAEFGLRFDEHDDDDGGDGGESLPPEPAASHKGNGEGGDVVPLNRFRKK